MKLLKGLSVLVAVGGLVILAAAASGSGRSAEAAAAQTAPAQGDRAERPAGQQRSRELTILAGRGAEIGVSVRDLEAGDKTRAGVVVDDVRPDSPAEKAGLKRSDVIVEFDGEAVRSARQFTRLVQETPAGRTVTASVVSGGTRKNVQITPSAGGDSITIDGDRIREGIGDAWRMYERMPPFNFDFDLPFMVDGRGRLGITVQELTPQLASFFGVKDGVLVTAVTDGGPASRAGLKAGDVIARVNDSPIRSREDLLHQLREVKDDGQVSIGIVRDKKEMTVSARLEPRASSRSGRPA
jgi:serine protease Do